MVGVERDVTGFPSIGLVGEPGDRGVRIAGRGCPTRVDLVPLTAE